MSWGGVSELFTTRDHRYMIAIEPFCCLPIFRFHLDESNKARERLSIVSLSCGCNIIGSFDTDG